MKKKDVVVALAAAVVVIWILQPPWIAEVRSAIQEWREPPPRTPNRYELRARERNQSDRRSREQRRDDSRESGSDSAARQPSTADEFIAKLEDTLQHTSREHLSEIPLGDVSNAATLSGKITVNGRPPQHGTIVIQGISVQEAVEVKLSPDGSYESEGHAAGASIVRLRVTTDGDDWRKHSADIALQKGRNIFSYDFPAYGSVAGKVSGLRENETGGVFAIKGEYSFTNVSEDDLYDFGDIADAEAHVAKDGTFTIRDLEAGHYTIIAFSGRYIEDRKFFYVFKGVDVTPNSQSHVVMSLD